MRLLCWIIDFAFGCHHKLSGVVTIRKRTYQVCVECGREFPYSWELMRSLGPDIGNVKTPLPRKPHVAAAIV